MANQTGKIAINNFKYMILKTLNGNKVCYYVLVSGERWDKLSEGQREIITYNGQWRLAEKVGEKDYYDYIKTNE